MESPYHAPEQGKPKFVGNVFGHPLHEDGKAITTSTIIGYDPETDEFITRSRRYKLGQVAPAYEAAFSNARERLIKTFKENKE